MTAAMKTDKEKNIPVSRKVSIVPFIAVGKWKRWVPSGMSQMASVKIRLVKKASNASVINVCILAAELERANLS